jgi:hypothetical protein
VPLHEPLAAQLVALLLDQVSVVGLPAATLVGLAEIVAVGAGAAPASTMNFAEPVVAANLAVPAKAAVSMEVPT